MEHYYTQKPTSKEQTQKVEFLFQQRKFIFETGTGVFSKQGVDFGTQLLIETVVLDTDPCAKKILDVGCGYGPIGIVLAKEFSQASVHMTDVNERAITLSKNNQEMNDVQNVNIYQSNLFENIFEQFDVIVSNPPIRAGKKVVYSLFEKSAEKLNEHGSFYCVIQKKQGADSALKELLKIFDHCEILHKKGGYRVFKAIKESRDND